MSHRALRPIWLIFLAFLSVQGDFHAQPARVVERGALLFRAYCAACHGDAGRGDGPQASSHTVVPPDLTTLAVRHQGSFPHDRVYEVIDGQTSDFVHRPRAMPVWGLSLREEGSDADQNDVVRGRILQIVTYLESLQRTDGPTGVNRMHELARTLSTLLPVVVSTGELSPDDTEIVRRSASQLAELAHDLGADLSRPTSMVDPTLTLLGNSFRRQARLAERMAKGGDIVGARLTLRGVSAQCITCHTRIEGSAQLQPLEPSTALSHLPPLARADWYAATRRFDEAAALYRTVLADAALAQRDSFEWYRASRHALEIAVRGLHQPEQAAAIFAVACANPAAPPFLRRRLESWRSALEAWRLEPAPPKKPEALVRLAQTLLDRARKAQRYPMDHDADVLFLRASLVADRALAMPLTPIAAAQALAVAGEALELFGDSMQVALPQQYYEACVRRAPHSAVAKRCLELYQSRLLFLSAGSAGLTFDPDEAQRLEELQRLGSS